MAYIYMVRCEDGSLYTGIARDLARRMREHYYRKKSGAKYTKSHPIKSLEMVWETNEWSYAAKLEFCIKRLNKQKKEGLILYPNQVNEILDFIKEGITYEPHPEYTLEECLRDKCFPSSLQAE